MEPMPSRDVDPRRPRRVAPDPRRMDAARREQVRRERVRRESLVPQWVLKRLEGKALFYPGSGGDLQKPVDTFAPWISDFWFVDLNYFTRPGAGLYGSADESPPVLDGQEEYQLIDREMVGPAVANVESSWDHEQSRRRSTVEPGCLTETYRHLESGKEFRVHRRRGFGLAAFYKEDFDLGVFYFRAPGEWDGGGWLEIRQARKWLAGKSDGGLFGAVLDTLADGGLIVSDGSGMDWRASYTRGHFPGLHLPQDLPRGTSSREAFVQAEPFEAPKGFRFAPVGYVGAGNSTPTLMWRVTR